MLKEVLEDKLERDAACRMCHLGSEGGGRDCGVPIELGCSCKGDLGSAHKQCALTWFEIKGDTTCEICGVTALNIAEEQKNEANGGTTTTPSAPTEPVILVEIIWHGDRIMNFLFGRMVFGFVISWLFHFIVI